MNATIEEKVTLSIGNHHGTEVSRTKHSGGTWRFRMGSSDLVGSVKRLRAKLTRVANAGRKPSQARIQVDIQTELDDDGAKCRLRFVEVVAA